MTTHNHTHAATTSAKRNGSVLFARFLSGDRAPRAKDLAKKLGISQGLISHWRTGRTKPSLDLAVALQLVSHGAVPAWAWLSDDYSTELLQMIAANAVPVAPPEPPKCDHCGQVLPQEKSTSTSRVERRAHNRRRRDQLAGAVPVATTGAGAIGATAGA